MAATLGATLGILVCQEFDYKRSLLYARDVIITSFQPPLDCISSAKAHDSYCIKLLAFSISVLNSRGDGCRPLPNDIIGNYVIDMGIRLPTNSTTIIISMIVCVCACVRYGRSPEVIRPPGKCYFFLWGMATVGQREGVQ